MSIRSGKGDKGYTDLYFNRRVNKDSDEINAIGDLDEINSMLGLFKARTRSRAEKAYIEKMQHTITTIASEIAVSGEKKRKLGQIFRKEDADWIENEIRQYEKNVAVKSCFCFPGENVDSAFLDLARAVVRRAERNVIRVSRKEKMKNPYILSYLNCLSDLLYLMARDKAKKKLSRRL